MVKLRSAAYCNLKLFLIYLVVYGHWIEAGIHDHPLLMAQYRWIYLVHMPLFAFLSGLFLKDGVGCLRQIRRLLPLYLVLQTGAVLLGQGTVQFLTPWWHLWYLLSFCTWAAGGWLWFRFGKGHGRLLILILSVLAGCGAGYAAWIGRVLSLSRTLVFFPYFWAGLFCPMDFDRRKLRLPGFIGLGLVIWFLSHWGGKLSAVFLYQAGPYGAMAHGSLWRLACYGLGALLCMFLLAFTPGRRFPWTRAGADTMAAYLIHAPMVYLLRQLPIPWVWCPLLAAALLYGIYKTGQWSGALYGIVPAERRDGGWSRFRKSTKHTASRCTGSCCP